MAVRMWSIIKADKKTAFNNLVRAQGFDPGLQDSLDVPLWNVADDPSVDSESWYWQSWGGKTEQFFNDLVAAMALLGQLNHGGPPTQGSYYRDDEEQTGATKTTAPVGGWTNELVLADLVRKPDQLQVDSTGPI